MAGLYIHIPFCKSRCIYCGFYSTTLSSTWQDRYVDALCREMEMRTSSSPSQGGGGLPVLSMNGSQADRPSPPWEGSGEVSTIYLGGGTPSLLSAENLRRLFAAIRQHYDCTQLRELTIECNPDDVTLPFVAVLPQLGITRVSLGAQTFSDDRLRFLHRRHTAHQVDEAIALLRHAGIRNISLDLMFGFPNQTLDEWDEDIAHAIALQPEHISAYSLMYEEGTPLFEHLQKGHLSELSDELSRQMYELLINRIYAAGYEHYEISNWARKVPLKEETSSDNDRKSPWRSLHNSSYWNQTPYIGIGAAAHSYDGKTRSWNVSNLQQYVRAIESGQRPYESEIIDDDTRYNDIVTTALRTREGINLSALSTRHREYLLQQARRSLDAGLLAISDTPAGESFIHLTRQGLFVSDDVMSDLIWV